ncbi:MAG: tetratricopeptide repeat protein [bacterium]|nr:tetratricopeptide repeat protein [bacterium]
MNKNNTNFRKLIVLCVVAVVIIAVWTNYSFNSPEYRNETGIDGLVGYQIKGRSVIPKEYNMAADLIMQNKVAEAELIYLALIQKDPGRPDPYIGLSTCSALSEDYESMRVYAMKALKLNPESTSALINLATSYNKLNEYNAAIETFQNVLNLTEGADAHWGLVRSYFAIGEKKKAQIHLDHFKRLAPNSQYIEELERLVSRMK